MSQGRDERSEDQIPMPPIRGTRPLDSFTAPIVEATPIEPVANAIDPWGAQDVVEAEPEPQPVEEPLPQSRGGGLLTIPLLCMGIAVIACVTLLPMADDNHRLAWEREKLRADLEHLKEQVRVNGEFLDRVADDPVLAERLAQRQMKYVRQGTRVLPLRGTGKEEMSPFHLVAVAPPPAPRPYEPGGGALATLVRQPRARLYLCGGALLLIAAGLVLGYAPRGVKGAEV
jgi:hypothetical protein